MKVSELTAALQKVQQIAGDVEIKVKHAEQDIETVLRDIVVHVDPASGGASGKAVLQHEPAPSTPVPSTVADAPPDPA